MTGRRHRPRGRIRAPRDAAPTRGALGAGSIALISLAAVLTLRGFPVVAVYGWSSIALYVVGALVFFVPLALVSAELATAWPRAGGVYAWVREAFGDRPGFLAVWFEWIENVVWFPTVLSFVAAMAAYVVAPGLADDRAYLVVAMLAILWSLTLANLFGMRWTGRVNNPALILGTLAPAALLIGLGAYWIADGRASAIPFAPARLVPDLSGAGNLVFFAGVLLGYAGIEMTGFHAGETRDPARDYPRAVFLAAGPIVGISILGTLAIAIVVPRSELSLITGLPQAFAALFGALGVGPWAARLMAALTGLGTLALISTWLLGPAKGLYATGASGDLPPRLQRVSRRHEPVAILVAQGLLGSLFALLFLVVPSVDTSYWMLSALTAQIVMVMYVLVFAAALRLRYTRPETLRPYRVPGGLPGIWLVAGLGIGGSAFGLVIGFVPPSGLAHWPTPVYVAAMAGGIAICSLPPFLIDRWKRPGWRIATPDAVLLGGPADASAGGGSPPGRAGGLTPLSPSPPA